MRKNYAHAETLVTKTNSRSFEMLASQSCTSSQGLSISTLELFKGPDQSDFCRTRSADGVAEGVGLAHDAGNILGALSLYAELLSGPGVLSDEYRPYAEEIRLLAERSNILIERLAGYTRQSTNNSESAVLPQVVNNYRGLLSRIIRRPVHVTVGPNASHPIPVSSETIERILVNLVKNAAAVTPMAGMISVTIEGSIDRDEYGRRRVVMTVRDDGPGMSKSALDRLRGLAWHSKTHRRGLGLRIVRELAVKSGGCVEVDSHPGCGTRVSVTWFENRANAA
ncbi:sensor histidine kinase [Edaphobacter modestus]|nr:HAMP domain-containing sensor histidine kinase [Edaphobacter modestus]